MRKIYRIALVAAMAGMLAVPAGAVAGMPPADDAPSPADGLGLLYNMFHAYRYRCGAPEFQLQLEYRLQDTGVEYREGKRALLDRALEVLQRRLDYLDAPYAYVHRRGEDTLVVTLAGPRALGSAELKELLGSAARLEFMMVDDEAGFFEGLGTPLREFVSLLPEGAPEIELDGSGMYRTVKCSDEKTLLSFLAFLHERGAVGDGRTLAVQENADWGGDGTELRYSYSVIHLHRKVWLSNVDIASASVAYGYNDEPQVSLQFTEEGARVFEQLTAENVARRLAIVLDGKVSSAPVIKEAISGGRAVITLGYGSPRDQLEEATNLARSLRSGAYAAPLELVSERTVMNMSSMQSVWRQVLCKPVYLLGPVALVFRPWAAPPR